MVHLSKGSDRETNWEAVIIIQASNDGGGSDHGYSSGSNRKRIGPGCSIKGPGWGKPKVLFNTLRYLLVIQMKMWTYDFMSQRTLEIGETLEMWWCDGGPWRWTWWLSQPCHCHTGPSTLLYSGSMSSSSAGFRWGGLVYACIPFYT